MLGGGNYLEAESLACWAGRAQPAPKQVVYGATELLRWAGGGGLGRGRGQASARAHGR